MSCFALLFCTLVSITTSIEVVPTCQERFGATSSGNPGTSTVSCNVGETMVSCGIRGTDNIGGTNIAGSPSVCTAYDYSSGFNLAAAAQCCTFPAEATVTTSTVVSSSGTSVSATCAAGDLLTGCGFLYVSGSANAIQGAYSGVQGSPPGVNAWIPTGETCNAVANAGTTVQAVANCVSIGDASYSMSCETKANYVNRGNFEGCQADNYMMACAAFSNAGNPGLDSYYVTNPDTCYVQRDGHANQFANAICCRMILTTSSPTRSPSKTPTKTPTSDPSLSPTRYPTLSPTRSPSKNPTRNPSQSPTRYPSVSPTRYPSQNPTRYPSISPTRYPSVGPTRSPSKSPTDSSDSVSGEDDSRDEDASYSNATSSSNDEDSYSNAIVAAGRAVHDDGLNAPNDRTNANVLNIVLSNDTATHLYAMCIGAVLVNIVFYILFCRTKPSDM